MAGHQVAVVMGSKSDLPIMSAALDVLREFGIEVQARVTSAHRAPDELVRFARAAEAEGVQVFIAGAGAAAHLPGVLAALTPVPVLGVPLAAGTLGGFDALLSIVQMPKGVPVATFAVGGAANAALFAVQILSVADPELRARFVAYKAARAREGVEILPS